MLGAKIGFNWTSWPREDFILCFVNELLLFHYYFPLTKKIAFHFNKFESPSPKKALCQDWLKLVQSRKIFFWFPQCIFLISLLSLQGKRCGPSFDKNLKFIYPRMICVKFQIGWNCPSDSGEATKMWKIYDNCSGELKRIINLA